MRILFFGNNRLGYQVLEWLRTNHENIVGVVLHPQNRAKYHKEFVTLAENSHWERFDGSMLNQPEVLERIRMLAPELGISVLFGYILKRPLLDLLANRCINLHPSYLPFNRGAFPNVWSIVDDTPAGATLHYIDEGIDTGAIVAQVRVPVEPIDTGASLYTKLEEAALELFKKSWTKICDSNVEPQIQDLNAGTRHSIADVKRIDEIDMDCTYTAKELINILRARTFPPHDGAYFWSGGRKIFMRLELYEAQEQDLSR